MTDPAYVHAGWWSTQTDLIGARKLLLGSWLNVLLICLPLGWVSHFVKWSPYATFLLNLISLVPLALMLGEITEDLALRFGDTIGESSPASAHCIVHTYCGCQAEQELPQSLSTFVFTLSIYALQWQQPGR